MNPFTDEQARRLLAIGLEGTEFEDATDYHSGPFPLYVAERPIGDADVPDIVGDPAVRGAWVGELLGWREEVARG